MAARSRENQQRVAEIGPLPHVADPDRKARAEGDLLYFLVTYFPDTTGLYPFSDDHKRFILRLESSVLHGAREIDVVYRGFGKTTIGEYTAIWAALYGHKRFFVVLGFNQGAATENLENVKGELEGNELLTQDFPEVCLPIQALEGKSQRCASQTQNGQRTVIQWKTDRIVLPTVAGSPASGTCIATNGLLSCRRGMVRRLPDGGRVRPDFVFVDDPQDDESAANPNQVAKRLSKLHKTVLRLGGRDEQLAVFCAATIIEAGDFPAQLLDAELYPSWRGERVAMVRRWPKAHATWLGEYADLRNTYDRSSDTDQLRARKEAFEYYRDNRDKMDAGAEVSWVDCYSRDREAYELSAIQHAYNILIDDGDDVFQSECQNNPKPAAKNFDYLDRSEIAKKVSTYKRHEIPENCTKVTGFIDVHGKALYWMVVAWTEDATGYVIDYGTTPEQNSRRFSLRHIPRTLRREFRGSDQNGAITKGLVASTKNLFDRKYTRTDGVTIEMEQLLIDSAWGPTSELVKRWVRQCDYSARILPSQGQYVGPDEMPVSQRGRKAGEIISPDQWMTTKNRLVLYDVSHHKVRVHEALALPTDNLSSLHLYRATPAHHDLLAGHLIAEIPDRCEGKKRSIVRFTLPSAKPDNHWFDCLVGCRVAASMRGISPQTERSLDRKKTRRRRRNRSKGLDL